MATVTVTEGVAGGVSRKRVYRWSGTGAANTDATLTTTTKKRPLLMRQAYGNYGSAVTQAGVTFGVDSGLGSTFDATLSTGSANAQVNVYVPDNGIILYPGDAFTVTCPAGGAGDVAYIQVIAEEI